VTAVSWDMRERTKEKENAEWKGKKKKRNKKRLKSLINRKITEEDIHKKGKKCG
jgi:hypothetical protein